uniref:Uncharacterized protein n=1 Tax=Physcomitrium patens TaxID=3218 RepID=A0A2K1JU61_PHYPA|nr:hypothetical protein PHYPA_014838 [Physcomitrium patens]PNR45068.1 hypothetical protein PHYPA_014839 [Physcomitrium patens]
MKDGVGRLEKLLFTANFGRTFDSDLKVRPLTTVYSLSNFLQLTANICVNICFDK